MKRREFLKKTAAGTVALSFSFSRWQAFAQSDELPHAAFITNGEPRPLARKAFEILGGMGRFINRGDKVLIKPNIGWDRRPELAANTNPDVVAELTKMSFEAGAASVKVLDFTCNEPRRCYNNSGIQEAAEAEGARAVHIRDSNFKPLALKGEVLDEWPIYSDYLEADKVINVPIAKHHGMARVTLGLKNLMGVMGDNRGSLHRNFAIKMADINQHIMPTVTVIDAYRMLMDNGPQGGDPEDVRLQRTLIASPCTVSADVLALELFGLKLNDVGYIKTAHERGLAIYDIDNLKVRRVQL